MLKYRIDVPNVTMGPKENITLLTQATGISNEPEAGILQQYAGYMRVVEPGKSYPVSYLAFKMPADHYVLMPGKRIRELISSALMQTPVSCQPGFGVATRPAPGIAYLERDSRDIITLEVTAGQVAIPAQGQANGAYIVMPYNNLVDMMTKAVMQTPPARGGRR